MTLKVPGVEIKIIDNSDYVVEGASTAFGMCINAKQGTLDLKAISSPAQFKNVYGNTEYGKSESAFHALKLLSTGDNILYCKRVSGSALYASLLIYCDANNKPRYIQLPDKYLDKNVNYTNIPRTADVAILQLNDDHTPLIEGKEIAVKVKGGSIPLINIVQGYENSINNTLYKLGEKIKDALDNRIDPKYGVRIDVPNVGRYDYKPEKINLAIEGIQTFYQTLQITIQTTTKYKDINIEIQSTTEYRDLQKFLNKVVQEINNNYKDFVKATLNTETNTITVETLENKSNVFESVTTKDVDLTYKITEGLGADSGEQLIIALGNGAGIELSEFVIRDQGTEKNEEKQTILRNREVGIVIAENPGKWANNIAIGFGSSSNENQDEQKEKIYFNIKNYGEKLNLVKGKFQLYEINSSGKEIQGKRKVYELNVDLSQETNPVKKLGEIFDNILHEDFPAKYSYLDDREEGAEGIIINSPIENYKFDMSYIAPSSGVTETQILLEGMSPKTQTVELNVYDINDLTSSIESYFGIIDVDDENNGVNYLEYEINEISPSNYIRFVTLSGAKDLNHIKKQDSISRLLDGEDGGDVNVADYIKALDAFKDTTADILCLIDDGYSNVLVKQKLVEVAEAIRSVALLSIPLEYCGSIEKIKEFRNKLGINSCYGALLGPGVITNDSDNSVIKLTTGGYFAERVAYVEKNYGRQYAVAGSKATISGILGVTKNYKDSEWGELYQPYQVNLIRNTGVAFNIDGIKTLQVATTAMQSLPTVLVNNMIAKKLKSTLEQFKYELNTSETRARIQGTCSDYMANLLSTGVIAGYKVICNDSNNVASDIDANRVNITVQWIPVGIIEYIYLTLIIEKNSVSLTQ